jgi:formiminotetrahydrofolate cyclodeaminase
MATTQDNGTQKQVAAFAIAPWVDRLSQDRPTPGGGAAACVVAALGLSLVAKALAISARRGESGQLLPLAQRLRERAAQALGAAQEDERRFHDLAATWSLPWEDPRRKEAARQAVAFGLRLLAAWEEDLSLVLPVAGQVRRSVRPDARGGAGFVASAGQVTWENVAANGAGRPEMAADVDRARELARRLAETARRLWPTGEEPP